MRKVIIIAAALAATLAAYWTYVLLTGSTPLYPPASHSGRELKLSDAADKPQQIGSTVIRQAEQSYYVVRDEATKHVRQVFGFTRLANPGSQSVRWQVEKPYMIFYESGVEIRLDADNGLFQIERTAGGVVPKDAQLEGHVTIRLTPQGDSELAETVLTFDDLMFSSERTEFSTDGPVQMASRQIDLQGQGLVLLFNAEDGQIDYLHILDLHSLRLRNQVQNEWMSSSKPTEDQGSSVDADDATAALSNKPSKPSLLYACMIQDQVKIRYGDQLVVAGADNVSIQNIALGRQRRDKDNNSDSVPVTAVSDAADQSDVPSTSAIEPTAVDDDRRDVVVTCRGGILFKLMPSEQPVLPAVAVELNAAGSRLQTETATIAFAADQNGALKTTQFQTGSQATLPAGDASAAQPPTWFEAQSITYDLASGSGLARGPVKFVFYQPADPDSGLLTDYWPMEITADGDTEFIAGANQQIETVIFNHNVSGNRTQPFAAFTQEDAFRADKMVIGLGRDAKGQTGVQTITLRDGDVYAESKRTHESLRLAMTRLSCAEIVYDQTAGRLVATGPGQIELDNSKADASAAAGSAAAVLSGPSFAQLKGFEKIEWTTSDRRIIADGGKDLLDVSYIPLVEGKPDKMIRAAAGRVEMVMTDDADGRTQLARLDAQDRVFFEEQSKHILEGAALTYDAVANNGWLSITGTEGRPCMANGARVPYIHYNIASGDLNTRLSTLPGAVPLSR